MTNYTFQSLFDFTRTTSGTFVGSNGLIQTTPASVNLLTFTQEFDNAIWTKSAVTATANTTAAPDGTSTADTITEDTSTGTHIVRFQPFTVTSGITYTAAVYVKANGRNRVRLINFDNVSAIVSIFNLSTGTVVSGTGSILSVGNGWYRITQTFTGAATGATNFAYQISLDDGTTNSYTGNGTSGIFLWGAQLELGSTATTYTRNNGGVFPARFDYDPATLAPKGILIEEQRTNTFTYSEDFTNAIWAKGGVTVSADAAASPDGTVDADKIVEDTSTGNHNVFNAGGGAAGVYTMSAFAKPAGRNWFIVRIEGVDAWFNLANGTIGSVGAGLTAAITPAANGYYRCAITKTLAGATACTYRLSTGDGISSYTGDGVSGVFLWGAQLEAGAFATSYIPTVASQVTRAADQCTIVAPMFAPWYNQSEGTFVVAFDMAGGSASVANNRITLSARESATSSHNIYNGSGQVTGWTVLSGVDQAYLTTGAVAANTVTNIAYAYKANDFAASRNGGTVATDTSGTLPTPTVLGIGSNSANALFLSGHIRSAQYYPFRASDTQLQALST